MTPFETNVAILVALFLLIAIADVAEHYREWRRRRKQARLLRQFSRRERAAARFAGVQGGRR